MGRMPSREHQHQGPSSACAHHSGAVEHGTIVRDPVCGMNVDTRTAKFRHQLGETPYFFCSERCLERFKANPDCYLNPPKSDPAVTDPALGALPQAAEGAIWTCPMHPEIRRNGPGSCPICGMALEPLEPTAEEGPNPELVDMSRRFWVSAALSVPLVALAMAGEIFGIELLPMRTSVWVQLVLATPVVLWGGWPFFERFWASLKTRNLNMFTLIGLGVGVAYTYSVVATLAPQIFPDDSPDHGRAGPRLFRSRRGDHDAGAAWPGARASGPAQRPEKRSGRCSGWLRKLPGE
jgi:P-type Cu+ transporter